MTDASEPQAERKPRMIFLVTEDWYVVSHRLPMMRAAREAGYRVIVICRCRDHRAAIEAEGFKVIPVDWSRRSLNPFVVFANVRAIANLYYRLKPDVVFHVAMKPVLMGSIAAWMERVPRRYNLYTGLGHVFAVKTLKTLLIRLCIFATLRVFARRSNTFHIFQNADDQQLMQKYGPPMTERTSIIAGSGVDTESLRPLPAPADSPVVIGFAARMLKDKGVKTLLKAFRVLRKRGHAVQLLLAGQPDPENPSSLKEKTLKKLDKHDDIVWCGHVQDIREVWAQAHIAVLPSLREGLPKSLLDAAACGRPLVATDVAGNRSVVLDGETGYRVPVNDPKALANALEKLVLDAEARARMGAAARKLVEEEFSTRVIAKQVSNLFTREHDCSTKTVA